MGSPKESVERRERNPRLSSEASHHLKGGLTSSQKKKREEASDSAPETKKRKYVKKEAVICVKSTEAFTWDVIIGFDNIEVICNPCSNR